MDKVHLFEHCLFVLRGFSAEDGKTAKTSFLCFFGFVFWRESWCYRDREIPPAFPAFRSTFPSLCPTTSDPFGVHK